MPTDSRPPETHELWLGEAALVYCFDFSDEPALTGGATLDSATVTPDSSAKVSAGTPQVLAADFSQYDADGSVVATVAAGEGVKVALTAVARGQTRVVCQATFSDGQRPIIAANFVVK